MRRSRSGKLALFFNGFCVRPAVSEACDAINPLSLVFSFDVFWYFIVFKVFNSSAFKLVWRHVSYSGSLPMLISQSRAVVSARCCSSQVRHLLSTACKWRMATRTVACAVVSRCQA